ncbi:MAG TPA: sulfite exporter TauE/SafE family protein, partial [Terriglobia bacterium]|nr:sulfite exporter TauE/SafE family protein [Terriglobia bacterium]
MVSVELLFPVSLLAGFVGAMSGMGGGIILIPALTLLGVDIKHAIAVSILSVIATSSGSASAYVRDHITNLKVGMFLKTSALVGAYNVATRKPTAAPPRAFTSRMMPSASRATTSLATAAEMILRPMSLCSCFKSIKMRTLTGRAVIAT